MSIIKRIDELKKNDVVITFGERFEVLNDAVRHEKFKDLFFVKCVCLNKQAEPVLLEYDFFQSNKLASYFVEV